MNVHNELFNGVRQLRWQHLSPLASTFFYIYQAFILLFHKAPLPLSLSLFLSICLSLSFSVVPHPFFLNSGLSLRFGDVDVFFLQSKVLCSYTHSLVNPSSDHFHTDAVVPSSDHCRTETVLPPSDHYCIDIVVPSSDHCCTGTVPPSSDHYRTTKVAPPGDQLNTKRTQQYKLIGGKNIGQTFFFGGGTPHGPRAPSGYATVQYREMEWNCFKMSTGHINLSMLFSSKLYYNISVQ